MSYKIVNITTRADERGVLSVVHGAIDMPFDIERVFWIHQLAPGTKRGGHAHRIVHQVIICMSGAINVLVDDGMRSEIIRSDRPDRANPSIYPFIMWAMGVMVGICLGMIHSSKNGNTAPNV